MLSYSISSKNRIVIWQYVYWSTYFFIQCLLWSNWKAANRTCGVWTVLDTVIFRLLFAIIARTSNEDTNRMQTPYAFINSFPIAAGPTFINFYSCFAIGNCKQPSVMQWNERSDSPHLVIEWMLMRSNPGPNPKAVDRGKRAMIASGCLWFCHHWLDSNFSGKSGFTRS